MFSRRLFTKSLVAAIPIATLLYTPVNAQELRQITFVQPSPSAINSFPVFVAIGEGYFEEEGLEIYR